MSDPNWMPIDSAPKDGTRIIAYWQRAKHCEDATLHTTDSGGLLHVLFDGERLTTNPTHWMPLPAPPTGEGGR